MRYIIDIGLLDNGEELSKLAEFEEMLIDDGFSPESVGAGPGVRDMQMMIPSTITPEEAEKIVADYAKEMGFAVNYISHYPDEDPNAE